jgi:HlyD family secretion protein
MSNLGKKTLLLGALGLVGAGLLIWWSVKYLTDPEKIAGKHKTLIVKVVEPKQGGLDRTTTQAGTIHAFQHVDMFPKISGFLMKQKVDIGHEVIGYEPWQFGACTVALLGASMGQGPFMAAAANIHGNSRDIIAEIDAPELYKEEQEAVANVEKANAQIKQMEAQLVAANAEVNKEKAEIKRSEAKRNARKLEFDRYKALGGKGTGGKGPAEKSIIPQAIIDQAEQEWLASDSGVDAAVATHKFAIAKVAKAKADLVVAQSQLKVAEAALEKARLYVEFTKISAPFNGRITKRNFHNGAYIRSPDKGGTVPLFTVQSTNKMRLIVQIPEIDVKEADIGDDVENLDIASLSGESFTKDKLKISRTAGALDELTRTMRVEIDILNPKGRLHDGMYGKVTIRLKKGGKDSLTLPSSCLFKERIYVVRAKKIKILRNLKVGMDDGQNVDILPAKKGTPLEERLLVTDQVVFEPSAALRDGTAVEPVKISKVELSRLSP